MKYYLGCMFLLCCISLSAVNLVNWDFTGSLPVGWTQTGTTNTHWYYSETANAGGTAGELMLNWDPAETGTFRYVSTSFNTAKVHDMALTFRQNVDWYAANFTLAVQISNDLTNWSTVWSITPTADIAAQTVSATVPWNWGASQTTYLAFVFIGNTYNLNYWWIDNINLSYTNTLGTGVWAALNNYPAGDVIVPSGHTLILQPGITVNMADNSTLIVQGTLMAQGTGQQKISLTTSGVSTLWKGIDIYNVAAVNDSTILDWCVIQRSTDSGVEVENSPKVRISNCEIKNNSSTSYGGGIRCVESNILVKGCFINANSSSVDGSGVFWQGGAPRFYNNRVIQNSLTSGYQYGALTLKTCDLTYVSDNMVLNNSFAGSTGAVYLYNCSGVLRRHLIANNGSVGLQVLNSINSNWLEVDHCTIVNNAASGIASNAYLRVKNTILWGHLGGTDYEIINSTGAASRLQVYFCCVQSGISGISGIMAQNFQSDISANPLFVSPTEGGGNGYDAYSANWRLQDLSPCIDAGDYMSAELDTDFSNPDIGIYPRRLKPTLYSAADVYPDQGRQIDLRWYPNDKDTTWDPAAWYHIFRSVDRGYGDFSGAVLVTDPRQITPGLVESNSRICWIHNDRILTYLGQMKAMNRTAYSLIVPTLQDSSATDMHQEVYVVTYFDNVYFWDSVGLAGHSVDNIPPMAPSSASLTQLSGDNFSLTWNEVTEGIWEGNSYPETNPITYLVYASDVPDFVPGPQTFLLRTTDPGAIISGTGSPQRFYRIIASDSR